MGEPLRILLIEDNPGDAELIRALLHDPHPSGFAIDHVTRLTEGIAALCSRPTDLILLDLGLPDSVGVDAVRRLRAAWPAVPVVVITGNDDERIGVKAVQEGAQDYLIKGQTPGYHLSRVVRYAVERQRFEDRLRESEGFLRATLDSLAAHIAIVDATGRILAVNRAWRAFAEANAPNPGAVCEGANCLDVCARAEGEGAAEARAFAGAAREVLAGLRPLFEWEYPCHGPTTKRWFLGRVTPMVGRDDRCAVIAHEDITLRKQAEVELELDRHRLAEAQRIARIGDWTWDIRTGEVFWSDTTYRLFGLRPGERTPSYALAVGLAHPDDRDRWARTVQQATATASGFSLEYRVVRTDGETIWIRNEAEITRDETGRAIRVKGTAQDITEKKNAEEALRNSELLLKTILDALPDRVVLLSPDRQILWPNLAACSTAGISRTELVGKLCHEAWCHGPEVCAACPLQAALRTGTRQEATAERGDRVWRIIGCPVRDERGTITGVVEISEDITDRLAQENNLRHIQKMESLGTLAGGIAHDFNNILSVILGYAELASEEAAGLPTARAYLTEVLGASARARNLIGQILAFSRQSKTETAPVQVHLLVKEAIRMLRAALPATIEIRPEISTFALAMADPTQIHQVILNLCTNAFHAMRATGGVLEIELADTTLDPAGCLPHPELRPGAYLRLRVSDTGVGMNEVTRHRAFEPYFTTKEKGEGTGLGLAISHAIVTAHHGAIYAESTPGKGSTFTVLLPRLEKAVAVAAPDTEPPSPRGRERVLLVDDEPTLLTLTRRALENLGYQVTTCGNGAEALEAFRAEPGRFDAVITDMTMPGKTGDHLARELLAARPDLPVILCTGYSEHLDEQAARAQGIRAFMMKPYEPSRLAQVLRNVLDGDPRTTVPVRAGHDPEC